MSTEALNTDSELFLQIASGDEQAFTTLYKKYAPQLLPFISKTVRTDLIADEVIQQVFLNIWISRDKLPGIENPKAWIFRVAANICYTQLKRQYTERRVIDELTAEDRDFVEGYESSQTRELASLVKQAIEKLPAQRKKIFRLSREAGMTHQQIAEELGISVNTVKNTMVNSLQSIREFLSEKGYQIPAWILVLLYL